MKIAICDDEKIFVDKIYKYLWQQPDCTVDCFLSPETLLEQYKSGNRYDVLFLDVRMNPVNGISLSKSVRAYDRHAVIVFLSAYLEYAPAGYEVNAFRYLVKPVSEDDIFQLMKSIRRQLAFTGKILFKTPQCELILHPEEILYLEARDKETVIFSEADTFSIRKGLNEVSLQLPSSLFCRIHRKYIVNLGRVREFDTNHLTLDYGHTLPVSRRQSRCFRAAMERYIEGGLH